jgi:hypothetical protein
MDAANNVIINKNKGSLMKVEFRYFL